MSADIVKDVNSSILPRDTKGIAAVYDTSSVTLFRKVGDVAKNLIQHALIPEKCCGP